MFAVYGLGVSMSVATAATIITSDILSKSIQLTLNSITYTLSYMAESSENTSIKKYHNDIEILDIEFKLNLLTNWTKDSSNNSISTTHNMIYNGIRDICNQLNKSIESINKKIKEHHEKWFHTYRTLYLDDEIENIKKYNKILNERLYLFVLD